MNTLVYVLVAVNLSGHWSDTVIPTLEFKTREQCERAIQTFKNDAEGKRGTTLHMRCVGIEK